MFCNKTDIEPTQRPVILDLLDEEVTWIMENCAEMLNYLEEITSIEIFSNWDASQGCSWLGIRRILTHLEHTPGKVASSKFAVNSSSLRHAIARIESLLRDPPIQPPAD